MHLKKPAAVISLCLMITILLSACGVNPTLLTPTGSPEPSPATGGDRIHDMATPDLQPIAMGSYIETLMNAQGCDDVRAIAAHGDILYIAAKKGEQPETHFFRFEDGQLYPLDYSMDAQYEIEKIAVHPNGGLSLLCTRTLPMEGAQKSATMGGEGIERIRMYREYAVYALEGDTFALRFSSEYIMRDSFIALSEGRYLLSDYENLFIVDAAGNRLSDLGINERIHNAALEGDTLYAIIEGENLSYMTARYEFPSGVKTDAVAIANSNATTGSVILSGDGAGGAYIASQQGLYHLNAGGSKLELLIDGLSYALGDTSSSLKDLCVTAEGGIHVLIDQYTGTGSFGDLYRYAWSDDAPIYAQREITIASLNEQPMIKEAISLYMRAHKDVKINYRTYLPMRYALNIDWYSMDELVQTRTQIEDAVRAINTEVLSGNAPDIFLLDSMPIASYIQKGYLDDMSAWAGTRPTDGTWVQSIASGYLQADGTLPCLTTKFAVPSLWGDRAQIDAINTLEDLAQAAARRTGGGHLLDTYSERSLLTTLFPICAAGWTGSNGKINFSVDELSNFLKQIKTIQDALPEADNKEGSSLTADNLAAGISDLMMLELGHRGSGEIPCSLLQFSGRRPAVRAMPALSGQRAFVPEMIVAVSAGSVYKDIAYDFLDLFVSESFLIDLSYDYGYSVVSSVCEKAVRVTAERYGDMEYAHVNGRGVKVAPLDDATAADVLAVLNSASMPVTSDYTLMTMIIEECMPYLRGEKSLESTAQSLYGRTKAYLAE